MNANEIARCLRYCYSENMVCGCNGCSYHDREDDTCTAENLELQAADLIESLQAQLAEIAEKPERTSPVRYYTDGKPYLQIGGFEMTDNPIVEACARLDRDEKYIIPHLQAQLAASQRREQAAVECLEKIYERTRPDGEKGGYAYGATTLIGLDVYELVNQWRGPQDGE